ncbi:Obg family GTPase CgtA, partial [Chloroflexota bacterium]
DGGDGGDGGSIIIEADPNVTSLRMLRQGKLYKAEAGGDGRGQKKHGKKGKDLVLSVPLGTVVSDKTQFGDEPLIADLEQKGDKAVIAKGGRGGLGNPHFVSSTNQAPRKALKGEEGEETAVILELKLIADVGIIGYPNVGKSTLMTVATAAKPEVASYPFTTRAPVLGVVEAGRQRFILAEIPGLIEDAHLGRGLGHDFLRHVVRTKMLIHLLDGSSPSPLQDMIQVNTELRLFDSALALKKQLVAINKIDMPQVKARCNELREEFSRAGIAVFFVSAAIGEGVPDIIAEAVRMLDRIDGEVPVGRKTPRRVFHPQPVDSSTNQMGK